MDKNEIENMIRKLMHKLKTEDLTPEEFEATSTVIRNLHSMLLAENKAGKGDKLAVWNMILGVLGKIVGGAFALASIIFLGDYKEQFGLLDKDRFAIWRSGIFPRG